MATLAIYGYLPMTYIFIATKNDDKIVQEILRYIYIVGIEQFYYNRYTYIYYIIICSHYIE